MKGRKRLAMIFVALLVGLLCPAGDFGLGGVEARLPRGAPLRKAPIVHTTSGPVQGILEKTIWLDMDYAAYKGVRYAEPPVGYLRFKPPVPVTPWKEVYKASVEGSVCPQINSLDNNYIGDEDCLFVNVFTPTTNFDAKTELKAVSVFIYGGSFKNGYGNSSFYGPELLVENDIVVVTLNYRLGALGFLAIGHENATGNCGLKDQSLALTWTRDNIKNFGGDPEKITIIGQSAGGASVDLHCLSPMSRGKFRGSIAMSASVLCPWAFHQPVVAKSRAFELAKVLDHPCITDEELLHFLYNASARDLVYGAEKVTTVDLPFKPTVENGNVGRPEDIFLSQCPYGLLKEGNFCNAPHMTGYTADEILIFASSVQKILDLLNGLTSTFNSAASKSPVELPALNELLNVSENLERIIAINGTMEVIDDLSDLFFVSCLEEKQNLMSEKVPVYYYRMSFDSQYALHKSIFNITLNGTAHEDDVGYLFDNVWTHMPTDPETRLSQFRMRLARLWSNFVKDLNPTPDGEKDELLKVTWPVSGSEGLQLNLDDKLTVHKRMASTRALVYQKLLEPIMPVYTGCQSLWSTVLNKIFNEKLK